MAKVGGPLMSMEASGKFGGALVFGKWKGRPTVRQLVKPANPNSADQETARNRTRVTGALQNFVNLCALKRSGQTLTDKALIKAKTPSGYAWNGYLTQTAIGAGGLTFTAAQTAYAALQPAEKTAWVDAAAGLTPGIPDVYQTTVGGIAGTPMSKGEVFFIFVHALSQMGLAAAPGATPPTYA